MKVNVELQGVSKETIELSELVKSLQVISSSQCIPPLSVLNHFFGQQPEDLFINSEFSWKPFTIDNLSYEELVEQLKLAGFKLIEFSPDVNDFYSWIAWTFEYRFGVPRDEHLELLMEERKIEEKVRQAELSGNDIALEELFIEELNITRRIQDLLEPYIEDSGSTK